MIDRYTTGVLDDKTTNLTFSRSCDHIPLYFNVCTQKSIDDFDKITVGTLCLDVQGAHTLLNVDYTTE